MEPKFFKDTKTGEVVLGLLNKKEGSEYVELKANSTDAAKEKHVPVITVDGNKVHVVVGSIPHPMTEEHHIAFIALVTSEKTELKQLNHTGKPEADFVLAEGEKVVEAYEYCNLHGLWVKKF